MLFDRDMRPMQFIIVLVCCLTNIADGVDIAALAFSAPVLIKDWGLTPNVMGTLFGATAAGLAIGAFVVARLADKVGRRLVTLVAAGTVATAMLLTSQVTTIPQFAALRFVTGLCLGTLAVTLNVMVSEFSNAKWRNPMVAMLHTGFSIGTMIGGTMAALLLEPYGWRIMFMATGAMNVLTFVLILFIVPESPSYLIARGGAKALERLNKVMKWIAQPLVDTLPAPDNASKRARIATLFAAGRRNSTIYLLLSQFIFAVISYLVLNWKPTVLVNAGLTPSEAGLAGLASGIAGIIGHIVIGFLSREGREVLFTAIFFMLLCSSLLLFGLLPPGKWGLILAAGFTSFCNVGVFTGLLLIAIANYPPESRTTSVSLMVGVARLGAITGPVFGGLLLANGFDRAGLFLILAVLSLVPIIAMRFISRGDAAQADVPAASPARS
ncbi:MAG: MFS transporter [Blastomonas sp.]